jgi:predicted phosphodiesterase
MKHAGASVFGFGSGIFNELEAVVRTMPPHQFFDGYLKNRVIVKPAAELTVQQAATAPLRAGYLRLVCISDTHNAHAALGALPPGDVLVHAGDFTDVGSEKDVLGFCDWLDQQSQFRHKVVIAGNHDLSLDKDSYERNWPRFCQKRGIKKADTGILEARLRASCTYLLHEGCEIDGVRFFGSPYQPEFYDWAFNMCRENGECFAKWSSMPRGGVDVLLTHGPPMGHGDWCEGSGHQGCADLLDYVERYQPRLHVFGHIHESYGATTNGRTVFLNASTLNLQYDERRPRPPLVFDVAKPTCRDDQ